MDSRISNDANPRTGQMSDELAYAQRGCIADANQIKITRMPGLKPIRVSSPGLSILPECVEWV